MPVESAIVVTITCDNPACPGHELDPADRLGWMLITAEIPGVAYPVQYAYCSSACASTVSEKLETQREVAPVPDLALIAETRPAA